MILGENVQVVIKERNQERKNVQALVYSQNGSDVQERLVAAGLAWVRPEYEDQRLRRLMNSARASKKGLWAHREAEEPVPPWEFVAPGGSNDGKSTDAARH